MEAQSSKPSKGKGGRGGYGGPQPRDVQVSKALSKLLRHQAEKAGITLDGEGYAPLDKVLAWGPLKSLRVSLADIKQVVADNEKQRFALRAKDGASEDSESVGDYLIRANQGHSIKVDAAAMMEEITLEKGNLPPVTLHGTYFIFWKDILASGGLKPMSRNHVHCASGTPEEGVLTGFRKDAELVIEVDIEKSLQAGDKWWISTNGAILTEGGEDGILSTKFFKKVTGRRIDVGVLWQDGEKIADLPSGLKMHVPMGKTRRPGH